MKLKYLLLICPSLCFAAPAQQNMTGQPNPMQMMSTDLGVTQDQLSACMKAGKPAQKGAEPDKAAVVQCLQKANPNITTDQFNSTMGKYKPKAGGKAMTNTMPSSSMPSSSTPAGTMPSTTTTTTTTPMTGTGQ